MDYLRTIRIKYLANLYTGNSISDDEKEFYSENKDGYQYISSKDIDVEYKTINYDSGMVIPFEEKNFKLAPKDSVLLCIEGGSAGKKIALLDRDVCFVNKLCCFVTNSKYECSSKYLFWALQSNYFTEQFNLNLSGLIGGVSINKLSILEIPYWEYNYQIKIAEKLDKLCSNINENIRKVKDQMKTLEQYKVSIITETILNPFKTKIIHSNVEWIGEVSNKAEIIRLKDFSYLKGRIGWQGLTADEFIDEGPYCVTGTDFINGKINWETCYHISEKRYEMDSNIHLKIGDLLVTKDGTIGKLARVNELPDKACLNSHLLIIRPLKNKYINDYLYYVLSSKLFIDYYSLEGDGSTMNSLSQEKIGCFKFPVYSLEEQEKIVEFLDEKVDKIDLILASKNEQLNYLIDFKKTIINEYVTGKKRVEVK